MQLLDFQPLWLGKAHGRSGNGWWVLAEIQSGGNSQREEICPRTEYKHIYHVSCFLMEGLTWDFQSHLDIQPTKWGKRVIQCRASCLWMWGKGTYLVNHFLKGAGPFIVYKHCSDGLPTNSGDKYSFVLYHHWLSEMILRKLSLFLLFIHSSQLYMTVESSLIE